MMNTKTSNPTEMYITYKSQKSFHFWDKKTETNKSLPKKFRIIPLTVMKSITGFDQKSNSGIYSNEVSNTYNEVLTVKCKSGELVSGIYSGIKDKIKSHGGKYTHSLYSALITKKGLKLVKINFTGAAVSTIIAAKMNENLMVWELSQDPQEHTKGTIVWKNPLLKKIGPAPVDQAEKASELDKILNDFLKERKSTIIEDLPLPKVTKEEFFEEETIKEGSLDLDFNDIDDLDDLDF